MEALLKKLAAIALLAGGGMIVVAAQGLHVDPNPQAYLRRLFPNAVAFSPRGGEPLHYKAYAIDPQTTLGAQPIGYAFWTTDLVPQEHGYHGPIVMLVGMDLKGLLTGVIVDYHTEPYGYFSVEPPAFAAQFKGKSIRETFRIGMDIHGVSRASISIASASRAIRDSARIIARQYLRPDAVKR